MLCLQNTRPCLISAFLSQRTIFYSIISPQVTLADWNPNDSEADDCYPVWSLSRLWSRAKKSLIHALIFRQDWFYSDINNVRGSFNHRHLSNIQQKKSPSSATNTIFKCCSLQGIQIWICLQMTMCPNSAADLLAVKYQGVSINSIQTLT